MNCAFGDLEANNGLLRPRVFVIDTQDSAIWVNGSISMKTESLDLRIVVTLKDFSPLSLRTPLLISGTMGQPNVSLEKGPLAGKVAGAALLSLLNPFAALLPFMETGTQDTEQDVKILDAMTLLHEARHNERKIEQNTTPKKPAQRWL